MFLIKTNIIKSLVYHPQSTQLPQVLLDMLMIHLLMNVPLPSVATTIIKF
jgi:hypothetical protein